jgi:F0F1-type ATP synthase assembly protein I
MPRREKTLAAMVGEYSSMAFLIPISTFVGYAIGYLLDKAFHTHFLYIPFLILGAVGGIVEIVRTLLKDLRDDGA